MTDYAELKRMAEAVKKSYADLCEHGGDELAEIWDSAELAYDDAANPNVVLGLIADLERNQRMLLAACMEMGAIGNALGADMNADGDELLGMVVELKAERDNLREDRDGLLEAGAHLL